MAHVESVYSSPWLNYNWSWLQLGIFRNPNLTKVVFLGAKISSKKKLQMKFPILILTRK